jgi:TRAP-type C4-dicarboxylate transport system permease small subunit
MDVLPDHPAEPEGSWLGRFTDHWLGGTAALVIGVMLLVGNANLALRWMTGQQLAGSGELLVVLLPVAVFLAVSSAERAGSNVRSTALTDRLPAWASRVVVALGGMVSLGMVGLLLAATASRALESLERREQLVGVRTVPVWPTRIAIGAGLIVLLLTVAGQLYSTVRRGGQR